ncbi:hypothetical protein L1987_81131 [Smallanthus sonchifolius]|uniref:Uncharacterized protein n=1 Tax=Smallanthus sonchifolius TaxID=185202 RepID=A0ACB8YQV8_9ASTR|nr:hypothetical protein L1987_81131 [Smallanthus sonchifolius]
MLCGTYDLLYMFLHGNICIHMIRYMLALLICTQSSGQLIPCEFESTLITGAGSGITGGSWWPQLDVLRTEHLQSGHVVFEWSQYRMQSP